jgi:hypothetical protein
MKKSLLFSGILACVFSIISCKKTELTPPSDATLKVTETTQAAKYVTEFGSQDPNVITGRTSTGECEPTEVTLIAGQTINSGTVTVSNDANYIYVTYATTNGWVLTQTHLYVGDCALIPVNNPGNPMPGQFPYTSTHNNLTTYTYQIPISRIPLEACGCIAAHAVVKKYNSANQVIDTQTGWGNGVRINLNGGNWGMKFDYCSCTPL